jgi:hypothetical protein
MAAPVTGLRMRDQNFWLDPEFGWRFHLWYSFIRQMGIWVYIFVQMMNWGWLDERLLHISSNCIQSKNLWRMDTNFPTSCWSRAMHPALGTKNIGAINICISVVWMTFRDEFPMENDTVAIQKARCTNNVRRETTSGGRSWENYHRERNWLKWAAAYVLGLRSSLNQTWHRSTQ